MSKADEVRRYAERHQVGLIEARRVVTLRHRLAELTAIKEQGATRTVEDRLCAVLDILIKDVERELDR